MICLWCADPTESENPLCPDCHAMNVGPRFHCTVPGHTVPTMGTSCAECKMQSARGQRVREQNAPLIDQLQALRLQHINEWNKPWPWSEFGKTFVGFMLNRAIRDLGGTSP